jgi:hypothetical protein
VKGMQKIEIPGFRKHFFRLFLLCQRQEKMH